MNVSKIIGIILIAASLWVGYIGITTISNSTNKINLLGLKIDASSESGQQRGYMYLVAAVALFGGGIYIISKSGK